MSGRRATPFARGEQQIRQRIIQETARIMAEDGVQDFALAKRKAAARLNLGDNQHLPSNREIEAALAEYLQLFHADTLQQTLRAQLTTASEALQQLARFEPRLVGPLLTGLATPYSEVTLLVHADVPEQVAAFLLEHGIPHETSNRRVRFGGDRFEQATVFQFIAGEIPVEITVLPVAAQREAPLSPVDGLPMKRATQRDVEQLLAALPRR